MTQGFRGHWKVQIVDVPWLVTLDKNAIHHGVQFADGFAYVNWQDFADEHAAQDAVQALGSDDRFRVKEIAEAEYMGSVKASRTEFL